MNGYISITLSTGEVVGLKFAYPAIRMFAEAMAGKGQFYYTEGDSPQMTIEGIAKFIECGYKNNCLVKEVEPLFKYENFFDWVESSIQYPEVAEQINRVLECYAATEYAKKLETVSLEEKKN